MKYIYTLMLMLTFSQYSNAQVTVSPMTLKNSITGTNIVYVNGQENTKRNATDARKELNFLIRENQLEQYIDKNAQDETDATERAKYVTVDFSFNRTQGFTLDTLESAVLALADRTNITVANAWKTVYTAGFIGASIILSPLEAIALNEILEETYLELYNATIDDTTLLKEKILSSLGQEKHLLILSHSQGNLFTNVAHQELINSNPVVIDGKTFEDLQINLGNLQVASPANIIEIANNDHLTNDQDSILIIPGGLADNFNLILPVEDTRPDENDKSHNHGILSTYFSAVTGGITRGNLPELRDTLFQKLINVSAMLGDDSIAPLSGEVEIQIQIDASLGTNSNFVTLDDRFYMISYNGLNTTLFKIYNIIDGNFEREIDHSFSNILGAEVNSEGNIILLAQVEEEGFTYFTFILDGETGEIINRTSIPEINFAEKVNGGLGYSMDIVDGTYYLLASTNQGQEIFRFDALTGLLFDTRPITSTKTFYAFKMHRKWKVFSKS